MLWDLYVDVSMIFVLLLLPRKYYNIMFCCAVRVDDSVARLARLRIQTGLFIMMMMMMMVVVVVAAAASFIWTLIRHVRSSLLFQSDCIKRSRTLYSRVTSIA